MKRIIFVGVAAMILFTGCTTRQTTSHFVYPKKHYLKKPRPPHSLEIEVPVVGKVGKPVEIRMRAIDDNADYIQYSIKWEDSGAFIPLPDEYMEGIQVRDYYTYIQPKLYLITVRAFDGMHTVTRTFNLNVER